MKQCAYECTLLAISNCEFFGFLDFWICVNLEQKNVPRRQTLFVGDPLSYRLRDQVDANTISKVH